MRKKLIPAVLPVLGVVMLAGAIVASLPERAEASRYAVAWSQFASDCGTTPAAPCQGG